jgi:hypothetical protein
LQVVRDGSGAPPLAEVQSRCNSVTSDASQQSVDGGRDPVRAALQAAIEHWTLTGDVAALEARLGAAVVLARESRSS